MCQPGRPVPREIPPGVLRLRLVRLPEREVAAVLLEGVRLLLLDLVGALARETSVLGIRGDPEVDVALDRIRVTTADQRLDEADDLRNRLGRLRQIVGHAEPEVAGVLQVPLGRARRELRARPGRGVVDLVVDVGDVVHERRVVARRTQPRAKPHADHERPRVADVCARVDRRSAEVHPHWPGPAAVRPPSA